jgi:hypothetical protein
MSVDLPDIRSGSVAGNGALLPDQPHRLSGRQPSSLTGAPSSPSSRREAIGATTSPIARTWPRLAGREAEFGRPAAEVGFDLGETIIIRHGNRPGCLHCRGGWKGWAADYIPIRRRQMGWIPNLYSIAGCALRSAAPRGDQGPGRTQLKAASTISIATPPSEPPRSLIVSEPHRPQGAALGRLDDGLALSMGTVFPDVR